MNRQQPRPASIASATMLLVAGLSGFALPCRAQGDVPPAPDVPAEAPQAAPAAGRHGLRDRFDAANTTHDGRLTLQQAQAGSMRMVARNFDAIDTGRVGYVTLEQVRSFMQSRRGARRSTPAEQ